MSDTSDSANIRIESRERLVTSPKVRTERVVLSRPAKDGRERVERIVHDHGNAAAVLPVDPLRRTVMVIRQLRFPVFLSGETAQFVEPCAGLIDPGEDAAEAMRREAMEEMGLKLGTLVPVGEVYTSPGFITEKVTLFLADYAEGDRTGDGGGLAEEGERIEVLEWPCATLAAALAKGELRDAKLLMLTQALQLRRPELFA